MDEYLKPERLKAYLTKRCEYENLDLSSESGSLNDFQIKCNNSKNYIKFNKAFSGKAGSIAINRHHLFGLYSPRKLFDVFVCLKKLCKKTELSFCIVNDGLILLNRKSPENYKITDSFFTKMYRKFDTIQEKFKIQLANDGCFAVNRCLNVFPFVMEKLLNKNGQHLLVELTFLYFKCFSKQTVCCRMQSIAEDSIVYDFEIFSYFYLIKYQKIFCEISKLLFPFIFDISNAMLQKSYLEIVPTSLIRIQRPQKIYEIITTIINERRINVFLLPNGLFQFGRCSNVPAKILLDDTFGKFDCESNYAFRLKESRDKAKKLFENANNEEMGIILVFGQNIIETYEYANILISEELYYHNNMADFFNYCKSDLDEFFKMMNELSPYNLRGIRFEITNNGYIKFNDLWEIRPSTLLKINDIKWFLERFRLVMNLNNCDYFIWSISEQPLCTLEEFHPVTREIWKQYEASEDFLLDIVQYLNPVLANLSPEFLKMKEFKCIPKAIFRIKKNFQQNVLDSLYQLRKNHIRLDFHQSSNVVQFDCWEFDWLIIIHAYENITELVKLFELIEEINDDFYELIIRVNMKCEFMFVAGCNFFKTPEVICEDKTNDEEYTNSLNKCLDIVKNYDKTTGLLYGGRLNVSSLIDIDVLSFLKMTIENQENFFEVIEKYKKIISYWYSHSDNRRSLQNEEGNFVNTYLNILKNLNMSFIANLPKEVLVSKNLELLPINLFPPFMIVGKKQKEKFETSRKQWKHYVAEMILAIVKSINKENIAKKGQNGYSFFYDSVCNLNNLGNITLNCIELTASKWLQLTDANKIVELNYDMQSLIVKWNLKTLNIKPAGILTTQSRDKEQNLLFTKDEEMLNQKATKEIIEIFMENSDSNCYFALNSNGDIRVGDFIWISAGELGCLMEKKATNIKEVENNEVKKRNYKFPNQEKEENMSLDFLSIGQKFDKAMIQQNDKNSLMKSVHNLINKSGAIKLAKKMNRMLSEIDDKFLENENFAVIPAGIYDDLKTNSEAYSIYWKIFEELEKLDLRWFINFNGHFVIHTCVTLTSKHLLKIENFGALKELVHLLRNPLNYFLICEEEILLGLNREERIHGTKLPDPLKTVEAKSKAVVGSSVEPNATILLKNIWVRPEDFLDESEKRSEYFGELNEKLQLIFGKFHEFCFQHNYLDKEAVVTSKFQTDDEKLTEYAAHLLDYRDKYYDKITIDYDNIKKLWLINNVLYIRSDSFWHLQSISGVMDIFQRNLCDANNTLNKKVEVANNIFVELRALKIKERIELDPRKKLILRQMGKVIWEKRDIIKEFLFIDVFDEKDNLYGVENIKINELEIFKKGNTDPAWLDQNDQLVFGANYLILALKLIKEFNEQNKCESINDFISTMEVLKAYCKYNVDEKTGKLKTRKQILDSQIIIEDEEAYYTMLNFIDDQALSVKKQQDHSKNVFKFGNVLKGLHHWFKHGYDFTDIKHYYVELNKFFNKNLDDYTIEYRTQYGFIPSRNYKTVEYFGVLLVPNPRKKVVATFYKENKKNKCEYLMISENDLTFTDNIMKYLVRNDNAFEVFPNRMKSINKASSANVKKIFIMLTRSINAKDEKNCESIVRQLQKIFINSEIVLCFNSGYLNNNNKLEPFNIPLLCLFAFKENVILNNGCGITEAINFNENDLTNYIFVTTNQNVQSWKNTVNLKTSDNTFEAFNDVLNNGDIKTDEVQSILIDFDATYKNEKIKNDFVQNLKEFLINVLSTFEKATILVCVKNEIIDRSFLANDENYERVQFVNIKTNVSPTEWKQENHIMFFEKES